MPVESPVDLAVDLAADPATMAEHEKDLIHVTRAVAELRRGAPVLVKAAQTARIVIAA